MRKKEMKKERKNKKERMNFKANILLSTNTSNSCYNRYGTITFSRTL